MRNGAAILESYLTELKAIHSSGAGVAETSYYSAVATLFTEVGKVLSPRVRCILHPKNEGAGIPDGGLFTADQFDRKSDRSHEPKAGQLPARGAIEVKPVTADLHEIARTKQVRDYVDHYGLVLLTNLRQFVVLERRKGFAPSELERYSLADTAAGFWKEKAGVPRTTAREQGDRFVAFLTRCCLHAATLTRPKDVAWFLASYGREALARVEARKELPALQALRTALEGALGMTFTGEKGEHFFRSTLVQTLFYGVFSAWVRWHRDGAGTAEAFDWRKAEWFLQVPFIRALYEEVAKPSRLGELDLVEVLDWTAAVLNRVERQEFFQQFRDEHAVQYFYEPFLEAYDPDLRKELGVWYTPREIVQYQVARVDQVLREELDLPDGLADPNVVVLDPCCGTGAYLIETLQAIARTLRAKGGDALVASDLKRAATTRVFGFEIMPAPFVVSHLQIGLLLQAEGAPLSTKKAERAGVYLTNALTGWEPPKGPKLKIMSELEAERDAAEHVKRQEQVLVILGNPPYNAFAGVSPTEEEGLVEPYKKDLNKPTSQGGWGIKKFNLDEVYVRFLRVAERRIAEMTGRGVVSFISSYSYLSDPSFVVVRQRLLAEFDSLWFDCMNGDSRETGKRTPEGLPDPSVFSTEYNREGIQLGTAVSIIVRGTERRKPARVHYRDFWGEGKRGRLLESLASDAPGYERVSPTPATRFSFRPSNVTAAYAQWPAVTAFCTNEPISGLQEMRRGALIDVDRTALSTRVRTYLDAQLDWATVAEHIGGLARDGGGFNAKMARERVLHAKTLFEEHRIRRYSLYPLDSRWCYHSPLWNRSRPNLVAQMWKGNRVLVVRPFAERPHEWAVMTVTSALPDYHLLRPNAVAIPLQLHREAQEQSALIPASANLSKPSRAYLEHLGTPAPDTHPRAAALLWMHALAIGYSPAYLTENADGVRRDWPRIPLPNARQALVVSATLGDQLAALLDTEAQVPGVTSETIRPGLRVLGAIARVDGKAINPEGPDLEITAGWGHLGREGVTMPGKGRVVERPFTEAERAALAAEAADMKLVPAIAETLLGGRTLDVYLNGGVFWRNVPVAVWEYHIGGYQVLKKWLSYREAALLGRAILPDEAREVTNIVRRLASIILLHPALDSNYQAARAAAYPWPN